KAIPPHRLECERTSMNGRSWKRATLLRPAAWFVLLGLVGFAPSSARASCGHYVVSHSGPSGPGLVFDLELVRSVAPEASVAVPSVPTRNLPCSGPMCSKGPGFPFVPAPLPAAQGDLWCCTTASTPPDGPELIGDLADEEGRHPRRLPHSI